MTPHISSKKEEIASIVLMPGDPLRAKWIAENFLTNFQLVNSVRNMYAYTGFYKGKKITVMGHGMGIGSSGIYTWELFSPNHYNVDTIIRVGSCGSYDAKIKIGQVIVTPTAWGEDFYARYIGLKDVGNVASASKSLLDATYKIASQQGVDLASAQVHSTDVFYDARPYQEIAAFTGSQVVEMEAYAIFSNAMLHNKKALCLLTCSDSLVDHSSMNSLERQTSFKTMLELALEVAIDQYPK